MTLPLEGVAGQADAQEVALQVLQRQCVLPLQPAQVLAFGLARHAVVQYCHVDNQRGQANARGRAGIHLDVEFFAQGVVRG